MADNDDEAREFGRRLAAESKPAAEAAVQAGADEAAHTMAVAILVKLLIDKAVIGREDAVAAYTAFSDGVLGAPAGKSGARVAETILDYIAGPSRERHSTS